MALRLSATRLLLLLQLAGCHPKALASPLPVPCPSGDALVRDQLFFGRGLPDGGEVPDSAWQRFLETEVTPRFPDGITVLDAHGQWRGRSGQVIRERSWLVILYHPTSEQFAQAVEELIAAYRTRFAQEAVLHDRAPTCVIF